MRLPSNVIIRKCAKNGSVFPFPDILAVKVHLGSSVLAILHSFFFIADDKY